MNEVELARIFKAMFDNPLGEKKQTAAKFLFGIKYAEDWGRCNTQCQERIAKKATGNTSAATEVNKGKMLAQYVTINPDTEARINNIVTAAEN